MGGAKRHEVCRQRDVRSSVAGMSVSSAGPAVQWHGSRVRDWMHKSDIQLKRDLV
jgi:hypothetical protein